MNLPRLRRAMAVAAVAALAAAALGIGVRATYGGQAAVDEPQYLMTALSLWEDRDLDISDEIAEQRYREYFDAELPVQTRLFDDDRRLSPHDPLLAVLLAAPVGIAGWIGAKVTLALLAAGTAALLVWVAVRRFAVPPALAGAGAAAAGASPPLSVYGHQVYPELPAALALLVAVALATGPLRRPALAGLVVAITALPWLGVKYAPVAAVVTVVVIVRLLRPDGQAWGTSRLRAAAALVTALVVSAAGYLAVHRLVWGGWTVYAAGDHFAHAGELSVVGSDPDYLGRSLRMAALLVDRGYGLVAWQPAWLLVVPAVAAVVAAGGRHRAALVLPLVMGWAVATWVALTMHGFWWPGRQVVVVLPLAALAVLWWLARMPARFQLAAMVSALYGVVGYGLLLVDGWARELTWVVGFEAVDNPVYQALRLVLPDYRTQESGFWPLHLGWVAVLLALLALGARSVRPRLEQGENDSTEGMLVS